MHFSALTLRGNLSLSNADRITWTWQPTIDFHEEGRPLQFNDTPAAAGSFARIAGDSFRLAGRGGLAG